MTTLKTNIFDIENHSPTKMIIVIIIPQALPDTHTHVTEMTSRVGMTWHSIPLSERGRDGISGSQSHKHKQKLCYNYEQHLTNHRRSFSYRNEYKAKNNANVRYLVTRIIIIIEKLLYIQRKVLSS